MQLLKVSITYFGKVLNYNRLIRLGSDSELAEAMVRRVGERNPVVNHAEGNNTMTALVVGSED
jgi:hypothetical protein